VETEDGLVTTAQYIAAFFQATWQRSCFWLMSCCWNEENTLAYAL